MISMPTYITLPSVDPSCLEGSTPGNYVVQLGRSLDFSWGAYEVFLLEARFRMTWHNVQEGENKLVLSGRNTPVIVPLGYYESVPQLCGVLNALFENKTVVFTPLPLTLPVRVTLLAGKFLEGPVLRLLGFDSKVGDGVGPALRAQKITT